MSIVDMFIVSYVKTNLNISNKGGQLKNVGPIQRENKRNTNGLDLLLVIPRQELTNKNRHN